MKNVIKLPQFSTQKELFAYLRKNADKIITQKRSLPTTSDDLDFGYSIIEATKRFSSKRKQIQQQDGGEDTPQELQVEVIANVSGWCDSQMDVMIKDNWNKSINDLGASGQKLIYHLKNHEYSTDSIVGKDPNLYTKDIDLSMFNFKSDIKKAQALLMSSTVCEDYDCKTFQLYEDEQIKQHSIGLQYIKIFMCINSTEEEDAMYKENWDKYYPQVINKDRVDSKGFFWAVTESKILEVSVVLYGSNELTPVLTTSQPTDDTEGEPGKTTPQQPSQKSEAAVKEINWDKVSEHISTFI